MYVAGLVGGDGTETGICEQGERQRAGGGRRGEGGRKEDREEKGGRAG